MQNAFTTQSSAPFMSHQTSQQTITAQYPTSQLSIFESTSTMRFPTFDDDEGTDNKAYVQQQLQAQLGTSHHVTPSVFSANISLNTSSQAPKQFILDSETANVRKITISVLRILLQHRRHGTYTPLSKKCTQLQTHHPSHPTTV